VFSVAALAAFHVSLSLHQLLLQLFIVDFGFNTNARCWHVSGSYSEKDKAQILISLLSRDAVALNIGGDSWELEQVQSAYDVALFILNANSNTGSDPANAQAANRDIKLFLSFDYTSFPCNATQTISIVNQFRDHPAQFKYDGGKPLISSYTGTCLGVDGWMQVKQDTNGYLMPFTYGEDYEDLRKGKVWGIFDSWYW